MKNVLNAKDLLMIFVYCTACNTPLETTNTDTKNSIKPYILNRLKHRNKTHKQQTSPIQQVPQGNNNPNKKYIITIIIAAIIIIILLFTKCSSSDEPTQKIQLLSQQHLSPNNSRQHPYLLLLLRNLCHTDTCSRCKGIYKRKLWLC